MQYYCILSNAYLCTSLCAQSWQYRDRRKFEVGTIPLSNDFKGHLLCTMPLRINLNSIPMIYRWGGGGIDKIILNKTFVKYIYIVLH